MAASAPALPVREDTGLPYASTATGTDSHGNDVPVMHACGHDVHVACRLGAARLFASSTEAWHGTLVALFQPAEETGVGAGGMVDDDLRYPVTDNDPATTERVAAAFAPVFQPTLDTGTQALVVAALAWLGS
jgi:hypothetical protein